MGHLATFRDGGRRGEHRGESARSTVSSRDLPRLSRAGSASVPACFCDRPTRLWCRLWCQAPIEEGGAAEFAQQSKPFGIRGLDQAAHQLAGVIALEEKRWDDALGEFLQANSGDAYNMYRMALAFEGKGDREGYVRMLRYVDGYRGVLNLNYSFVRQKTQARLAALAK